MPVRPLYATLVAVAALPEHDAATVAVAALPFNEAEIDPAENAPFTSLTTMLLAVFAVVAVVAEFATFPAVLIVANFVSAIAALADILASTIFEIVFKNKTEFLKRFEKLVLENELDFEKNELLYNETTEIIEKYEREYGLSINDFVKLYEVSNLIQF